MHDERNQFLIDRLNVCLEHLENSLFNCKIVTNSKVSDDIKEEFENAIIYQNALIDSLLQAKDAVSSNELVGNPQVLENVIENFIIAAKQHELQSKRIVQELYSESK